MCTLPRHAADSGLAVPWDAVLAAASAIARAFSPQVTPRRWRVSSVRPEFAASRRNPSLGLPGSAQGSNSVRRAHAHIRWPTARRCVAPVEFARFLQAANSSACGAVRLPLGRRRRGKVTICHVSWGETRPCQVSPSFRGCETLQRQSRYLDHLMPAAHGEHRPWGIADHLGARIVHRHRQSRPTVGNLRL